MGGSFDTVKRTAGRPSVGRVRTGAPWPRSGSSFVRTCRSTRGPSCRRSPGVVAREPGVCVPVTRRAGQLTARPTFQPIRGSTVAVGRVRSILKRLNGPLLRQLTRWRVEARAGEDRQPRIPRVRRIRARPFAQQEDGSSSVLDAARVAAGAAQPRIGRRPYQCQPGIASRVAALSASRSPDARTCRYARANSPTGKPSGVTSSGVGSNVPRASTA